MRVGRLIGGSESGLQARQLLFAGRRAIGDFLLQRFELDFQFLHLGARAALDLHRTGRHFICFPKPSHGLA